MSTYKTLSRFKDAHDGGYVYEKVGEAYPRKGGVKPTEERIKSLLTSDNQVGRPFIEEVNKDYSEDRSDNYPKHTGGGYFELSNGEKVQGKEDAQKAESALKE